MASRLSVIAWWGDAGLLLRQYVHSPHTQRPHTSIPRPPPLTHPPTPPPPQEATEALKPLLGDYYLYDSRNVMRALWDDTTTCYYVAPEEGNDKILWFRDSFTWSARCAAKAGAAQKKAQ